MSTATSTATAWHWPADVLSFAAQQQVCTALEPLHHLLQRLYPSAIGLRAFLEEDPEIGADQHILFEVRVPLADAPDYLAATRLWYEEFPKIHADPGCIFRLSLLRVD